MDKLEYGWWERKRGNVKVPPFIGEERNYTLSLEELRQYDEVLVKLKEVVDKERAAVARQYKAIMTGKHPSWEREWPRCTGLAHVLEFMVALAKAKLGVMQFLCDSTGRYVKEKRDGVSGLTQDVQHGQADATQLDEGQDHT